MRKQGMNLLLHENHDLRWGLCAPWEETREYYLTAVMFTGWLPPPSSPRLPLEHPSTSDQSPSPHIIITQTPRLLPKCHWLARLSQQETTLQTSPKNGFRHHHIYPWKESLPYVPKILFCQAQIFQVIMKGAFRLCCSCRCQWWSSCSAQQQDRTDSSTLWCCWQRCSHDGRCWCRCRCWRTTSGCGPGLGSTVRHVVAASSGGRALAPHFRRLRPTHSTTIHSLSAYHATIPYHTVTHGTTPYHTIPYHTKL